MFAIALMSALEIPDPVKAREREILATVTIRGACVRQCGRAKGILGAGAIVGRERNGELLVLTAKHVLEKMGPATIYLRGDGESLYRGSARPGRPGRIVGVETGADLALVAFRTRPGDQYAVTELSSAMRPTWGNVVGHPGGAFWTVSPYRYIATVKSTLVIDCKTCGVGDSGGGVFDEGGRVAGVLATELVRPGKAGADAPTGSFTAVAMNAVRKFLANWSVGGAVATTTR